MTDKQAARAARQLAYHRQRLEEIEARMAENSAALDHYLQTNEQEAAVLPGGYAIAQDDDGEIAVSAPTSADHGYQQLCLINYTQESPQKEQKEVSR